MQERFHPKKLLRSKITLYVLAGLAVMFVYRTAQVIIKKHQTENEITEFETQVVELEASKKRLEDLNAFLSTEIFAQKEARTKLGLQKPGEDVIILKNTDNPDHNTGEELSQEPTSSEPNAITSYTRSDAKKMPDSNAQKWWNYFFTAPLK